MSLRELNAARTRALLTETALALFVERGYDATTMDEVAQSAGVGTSTLYRYFPTKESLLLARLGEPGGMARALLARPADEPDDEALGHAVLALYDAGEDAETARRFDRVIETNSRTHAALLEWLSTEQDLLIEALARRTGRPVDDIGLAAAAWMAVFVLMRTRGEAGGPGKSAAASRKLATGVMRRLAGQDLLLPTVPR